MSEAKGRALERKSQWKEAVGSGEESNLRSATHHAKLRAKQTVLPFSTDHMATRQEVTLQQYGPVLMVLSPSWHMHHMLNIRTVEGGSGSS